MFLVTQQPCNIKGQHKSESAIERQSQLASIVVSARSTFPSIKNVRPRVRNMACFYLWKRMKEVLFTSSLYNNKKKNIHTILFFKYEEVFKVPVTLKCCQNTILELVIFFLYVNSRFEKLKVKRSSNLVVFK